MLENYDINEDGVVFQVNPLPITYDKKYVEERYDTYGEKNLEISALRLGYIIGVLGHVPNSILDIGYGNAAFLKECTKAIPYCYGYDVTGYPLPDDVEFVEDWVTKKTEVMTFFDVLEHLSDPYILKNAEAHYIIISLPQYRNISDEWFQNWKHRRPNEHLWHFNPHAMMNFSHAIGYDVISMTNVEDVVRGSLDGGANIMTAVLRKI